MPRFWRFIFAFLQASWWRLKLAPALTLPVADAEALLHARLRLHLGHLALLWGGAVPSCAGAPPKGRWPGRTMRRGRAVPAGHVHGATARGAGRIAGVGGRGKGVWRVKGRAVCYVPPTMIFPSRFENDGYYLHVSADGKSRGVWHVSRHRAARVGVPRARDHANSFVEAGPGEDIFCAMRAKLPAAFGAGGQESLIKTALGPGEYYPNIARPNDQHIQEKLGWDPGYNDALEEASLIYNQLEVMDNKFREICRYVHPADENLSTFGGEIRSLLILACTELEAIWSATLRKHKVEPSRGKFYTMVDYERLAGPMHLSKYGIVIVEYPSLKAISPFKNWSATNPTTSLAWYDAYNALKHDRLANFTRANLLAAIDALCACVIMVRAMYGFSAQAPQSAKLFASYQLENWPVWDPSEVYIHPYDDQSDGRWKAVAYAF